MKEQISIWGAEVDRSLFIDFWNSTVHYWSGKRSAFVSFLLLFHFFETEELHSECVRAIWCVNSEMSLLTIRVTVNDNGGTGVTLSYMLI